MEQIRLDIIPKGLMPVCHSSQYDKGRVIRLNLVDGLQGYTLTDETVTLNVRKPDNNIVTAGVNVISGASYVDIVTTEQMTACEGENLCEIVITKGDVKIASLNFKMKVEVDPLKDGIESESEINNLWTQVDGMVADALETQYDSANVVFDDEPTERHGIPYTVTSEGIGNAIDNALDMTAEASGAIATFESEYALPLRDLEIEINAVQESGTPTPSSPKAISGFTGANIKDVGKNLIDFLSDLKSSSNGLSISIDNGGIKFVNQPTASWADLSNTINVFLPKGTYTFSRTTSATYNVYIDVIFEDSTTATMSITSGTTSRTATYTKNIIGVKLHLSGLSTSTTYNETIYLQFEEGSTATTYNAYNPNSTTTAITWQDEAGTVYGGSLDVTSGVLTVTHGITTINDCITNRTTSYTNPVFYGAITGLKPQTASVKSDYFNVIAGKSSASAFANASSNYDFAINSANTGSSIQVFLRCDDYTDVPTLKTNCGSAVVIYELATPVTYQLTPTQINTIVGTNNVFTDTNGDTSLEYYTKRGEQTVRIAEGTAVDVINNDEFNTLNTTSKKILGAINELVADKFDKSNRVSTGSGTFAGLLNTGDRVWLIIAQRLSTNNTIILVAHKQGTSYYFKEIVKDSGMAYNYNQDNGSVVITYGGDSTGVYGGAYRLA
jgi:hypothetical protein